MKINAKTQNIWTIKPGDGYAIYVDRKDAEAAGKIEDSGRDIQPSEHKRVLYLVKLNTDKVQPKPEVTISDWCLGARPIAGGKLIVCMEGTVLNHPILDNKQTWTSHIETLYCNKGIVETKNTIYHVCGAPKQFLTKCERVDWGKYILRSPDGKRLAEAKRDGSRWTAFGLTFNTLWGCRVKADYRYLMRSCR